MKPEIVAVGIPGPFGLGGAGSSLQIQQDGENVGLAAHTRRLNFAGQVELSESNGQVTVIVDADPAGAAAVALGMATDYVDGLAMLTISVVPTFEAIDTSNVDRPGMYVVETDETNAGLRTIYFFDGAAIMWCPMTEA